MTTHGSVTQLVGDLRSDDSSIRNRAAQLIWERYFRNLLELARNHLNLQIRRRVDEEDVLQSMYKSFCLRQQRGEYDLVNRDALWKLLVTITLNKTRDVAKAQGTEKRDIARERPMPGDDETDSARWALEKMEATGPSPGEAALLNEALERRLQALADSELRQIAVAKLEGWTNAEIAGQLNYTERTIERRLERIRRAWMSFEDGTP
jgi:DNA-directed RNA polymerase specialized sigma24 family protein